MKIPTIHVSDLDRATLLFLLLLSLQIVHPIPKVEDMSWAMFGVILAYLSHKPKE